MSFHQDEQVLTKHFLDAWDAGAYSAIPVDTVSEKKGPNSLGQQVRFRVQTAPSGTLAIGGGARNFGSVLVQIIMRTGKGGGEILRVADFVRTIFAPDYKPVRIGAIRCRTPSRSPIAEEEGLVMATVDIPYTSDYSA